MIEAHWLFGVPRERIEIVIHPESIAPSLVAYVDGSVVAQVGHPLELAQPLVGRRRAIQIERT